MTKAFFLVSTFDSFKFKSIPINKRKRPRAFEWKTVDHLLNNSLLLRQYLPTPKLIPTQRKVIFNENAKYISMNYILILIIDKCSVFLWCLMLWIKVTINLVCIHSFHQWYFVNTVYKVDFVNKRGMKIYCFFFAWKEMRLSLLSIPVKRMCQFCTCLNHDNGFKTTRF